MKRTVALAMAGICLLSCLLITPRAVKGVEGPSRCFINHKQCRASAFEMNTPWYRMALALTVCDIALGKCILKP